MSEHDREPPSTPAVLTAAQSERVRQALIEYARGKNPQEVVDEVKYSALYIQAVIDNGVKPSVHFAGQLARAMGIELEELITEGTET